MESYDLAVFGNGFDLHFGCKTRYIDFYKIIYIVRKKSNYDYFEDKIFNDLENARYLNLKNIKPTTKKLFDLFNLVSKQNFFVDYFVSYNENFEEWNNFEEELKNILKMFNQFFLDIKEENYHVYTSDTMVFINLNELKNSTKYIFLFICSNENKYYTYDKKSNNLFFKRAFEKGNKYFIKEKIKKYINEIPNFLLSELKQFESMFNEYLNVIESQVKYNDLNFLFKNLITYNYTFLGENIFCRPTYHIHGKIKKTKKTDIIFGIDSSDDLIPSLKIFTKLNRRVANNTDIKKIDPLVETAKSIVIFGHSLDLADKDSLSFILKNVMELDMLTIYYFNGNQNEKEILANNLSEIIGKDNFFNLSTSNVLHFVPIPNNEIVRELIKS